MGLRRGITWVDYWATCDECGEEGVSTMEAGLYHRGEDVPATTARTAAKRELELGGWTFGRKCLCPSCATKD